MTIINHQSISLFDSYVVGHKNKTGDALRATDQSTPPPTSDTHNFTLTESWGDIEKAVDTSLKHALAGTAPLIDIDPETGQEITFYDAEEPDTEPESNANPTLLAAFTQPKVFTQSWKTLELESSPIQHAEPSYLSAALSTIGAYISPVTNVVTDLLSMLPSSNEKEEAHATNQHVLAATEKLLSVGRQLETLNARVVHACGLNFMPMETGRTDVAELSIGSRLTNYLLAFKSYTSAVSNGTIGMTSGLTVAAAGIATVGLIGFFPAAVLVGTGTLVSLYSLRSIPDAATRKQVTSIIDGNMPAIKKDLNELQSMLAEEIFRTERSLPITAEMAVHFKNYNTAAETINAGRAELKKRDTLDSSTHPCTRLPIEQAKYSPEKSGSNPTKNIASQFIEYLTKGADFISKTIIDQHKKDRATEASFKEKNHQKLSDLALSTTDTHISHDAYQHTHADMNAGRKPSEHITFDELRKNITYGAVLTRDIMSSDLNFGVIEHRLSAGKESRGFAIPSNLTTVRFITQYIDALVRSHSQSEQLSVQKKENGSYVVADPERKLYNFLSGAPSAYMTLIEQSDVDTRLAMCIPDYSSNFPGGTNHLEFETQRDANGSTSLVLRFSTRTTAPDLTHTRLTTRETRGAALRDIMTEASKSTVDFSSMETADIQKNIDLLQLQLAQHLALLKETQQQNILLDGWKNPHFIQKT